MTEAEKPLVPLHRGFEGLRDERREDFGADPQDDASGDAWLAADEALAFESQDHLMDRRRGDAEVALHVGLGGRSSDHLGIGVDEGQVVALLGGEAGFGGLAVHVA